VYAINFSFAEDLDGGDVLDGNSLLTQFVDWSAIQHEVLYVQAGTEVNRTVSVPTDNFNGITVAFSSTAIDGVFRKVGGGNRYDDDAVGPRTSVDLLAPGENITVDTIGNSQLIRTGTSLAAPHVTGTIALLQEEAATISANARRHQVMKAVLLNSADKIKGIIGMERTVLKKSLTEAAADDWFDTDAHSDPNIPLDIEMGAGHLNAARAHEQLTAGEHSPGSSSPKGWDYGIQDDEFSNYPYMFTNLNEGDYVAATLAWDRILFLEFGGSEYVPNDSFIDAGFWNLDLHLVNIGTGETVASSTSSVENLEHIFARIPTTGTYRLDVDLNEEDGNYNVPYALAWWSGPDLSNQTAQGDFNSDGNVDAADYVMWRKNNGSSMEYDEWVENFGSSSGSGGAAPEPAALVFVAIALCLAVTRRSEMLTCSLKN
jgi:hypothetical protein